MNLVYLRKMRLLVLAGVAVFLAAALVIFPREALNAAVDGMKIFFEIVFPSLLPFFILSEIMLGLGVVHCLGVLLEPMMRPCFNVPGVGAFALSMGLAAGYPMDAVITAKFRRRGMCSRAEGERLLAFTNTADPLFIFGAVAVGMFGLPRLGAVLAIAHYLSSFTVGFFFRFHRRGENYITRLDPPRSIGMIRRALRALVQGRREDGRPLGQLLGEAVRESVGTLLMIGGFIIFFSVLVKVSEVFGLTRLIEPLAGGLLRLLGLSPALAPSVWRGLLEIDLGTMAASKAQAALVERAVMASAIIAWSGLSVHGQVASVLQGTDIRMGPYVLARLAHAVLAGLYTLLLAFLLPIPAARFIPVWNGFSLARRFVLAGWQLAVFYGGLCLFALLLALAGRFKLCWRK